MSDKRKPCPICSTLFNDDTCHCLVANRHLDCDPETCKQAARDFLCGDITYAKASMTIEETGDSRNLAFWIERYFEETPSIEDKE